MHDNQEIIDEENRKLREIDPDWNIGSMGVDGNKVVFIGITVPIKGNAAKIRRLEADGWERTFRKKAQDGYKAFPENDDRTRIMLQYMRKDIRED